MSLLGARIHDCFDAHHLPLGDFALLAERSREQFCSAILYACSLDAISHSKGLHDLYDVTRITGLEINHQTLPIWQEYVITFYEKLKAQQVAPGSAGDSKMAKRLRQCLRASSKFFVKSINKSGPEPEEVAEIQNVNNKEMNHDRVWGVEPWKRLKKNFIRDAAVLEELQQDPSQDVQGTTSLANNRLVKQPHAIVTVLENKPTGGTPTSTPST
ncbi:hypothetical protein BDV93DRAFT_509612 [Ceratobasidium sp. AG-I]|nr:hypothetical protein BDV93DRAFT_509612 [Ceratobasidium sp. AG-I]